MLQLSSHEEVHVFPLDGVVTFVDPGTQHTVFCLVDDVMSLSGVENTLEADVLGGKAEVSALIVERKMELHGVDEKSKMPKPLCKLTHV